MRKTHRFETFPKTFFLRNATLQKLLFQINIQSHCKSSKQGGRSEALQRDFWLKTIGLEHYRRHFLLRNATLGKLLFQINIQSHRKSSKQGGRSGALQRDFCIKTIGLEHYRKLFFSEKYDLEKNQKYSFKLSFKVTTKLLNKRSFKGAAKRVLVKNHRFEAFPETFFSEKSDFY